MRQHHTATVPPTAATWSDLLDHGGGRWVYCAALPSVNATSLYCIVNFCALAHKSCVCVREREACRVPQFVSYCVIRCEAELRFELAYYASISSLYVFIYINSSSTVQRCSSPPVSAFQQKTFVSCREAMMKSISNSHCLDSRVRTAKFRLCRRRSGSIYGGCCGSIMLQLPGFCWTLTCRVL